MAVDKKNASGKRFGARYGRKTRHKFSKIEHEQRKNHKCPYCSEPKVKRVSVGIWNCKKCGAKFTGKAYTVLKKVIINEMASKEALIIPKEEEVKETVEATEEEKPKKYKEKKPEPEEYEQAEIKEEEQ